MRSTTTLLSLLVLGLAATACGSAESDDNGGNVGNEEGELVGGARDLRWNASGYLTKNDDRSKPACGATLISKRVVVTAAHCVGDASASFAFGAGDVGSGPLVKVVERHAHPDYHPEAEGFIDLTHALRKYDIAYLVLERDVDFATPAALPTEKPSIGCNVQAIGYGAKTRKSTPACVVLRLTLGHDPILEVHPAENSALCIADGDEGSPVVTRDASKNVLVGIFVGSVTQSFTDCVRGSQYLNGYESAFGYSEWLKGAITSVENR
jgi:hypothetical protein